MSKFLLSIIFLLNIVILCAFVTIATTKTANAQTLNFTAGQWRVFTLNAEAKQGKTCYIASIPTNSSGTFKKRGEPFAMVTHRGGGDEFSISSGYPYKQAVDVSLNIDGKVTALFAENDRAWAKDSATDKALISAMMNGTIMSAKGFSRLGSDSNDAYSLSGFTSAYRKMKELCK